MPDVFGSQDALTDWATGSGLRTVVVLVAGLLASLEVRRLIAVLVRSQMLGPATALVGDRERLERREHTVETFFTQTASTFITFAAGIIGLAIGFGAQTLVKDAIAGLFLLLESHYDIGDRVKLSGVEGEVIALSLRRTTLWSDDGAVHTIPNGSITVTSNLSQVGSEAG